MDIFYTERLSQAENDDALEDLTGRFMVAAAKDEKVLLETGGGSRVSKDVYRDFFFCPHSKAGRRRWPTYRMSKRL